MKKAITIFTNKYLLAASFLVVWLLFFDDRDVFTQLKSTKQLKELKAKETYYKTEIEKNRTALADIQSSSAAIEKIAREQFKMKKDGEDLYLVEEQEKAKK
jgi:cell division protein DivIC